MTRSTVSLAQQWRSSEETAGLELPLLRTLALDVSVSSLRGLADRVLDLGRVYVRYSEGPERDDRPSIDTESELELPGLSVNPPCGTVVDAAVRGLARPADLPVSAVAGEEPGPVRVGTPRGRSGAWPGL